MWRRGCFFGSFFGFLVGRLGAVSVTFAAGLCVARTSTDIGRELVSEGTRGARPPNAVVTSLRDKPRRAEAWSPVIE